MKHLIIAGVAFALAGSVTYQAKAADLDDDYVTRETIIEERPIVQRERIIVRRYDEPRYYVEDDGYYDGPRIGIVAGDWGGGWRHHHRGGRGVGWRGRHHW